MGIRYAKKEDIKIIAQINLDGWQTAYRGIVSDKFLESLSYERFLKNVEESFSESLYCVFENENNEILGFCIFGENRSINIDNYQEYDCELHGIYVKPEDKHKGIGEQLFNFASKKLLNEKKRKMMLWVLEENKPSIKFYKKMGGILIGRKEIEIGNETLIEVSFGYQL